MASLLDWDLESEVFPTVRWLVHHRRAKLVDVVHSGLKTIFTLSPKFHSACVNTFSLMKRLPSQSNLSRISQLSTEFKETFPQPIVPPLPSLLATISAASSKQTDNHFFAAVVLSKEHIPLFHDVVFWMLKHDLLYNLHLHVRIVATSELKIRVREAHERRLERLSGRQLRGRRPSKLLEPESLIDRRSGNPGVPWLPLSPKSARRYTRRVSSVESELNSVVVGSYADMNDEDVSEESDEDNVGWGTAEDTVSPSMIGDPGTASPLERKWLAAMSEGKDEHIAKRFEL